MALVSLYAPDSVPKQFLNLATELVSLVPAVPDDTASFALFDRPRNCACGTRNGLAIYHRTLLINRNNTLLGFPVYALPPDCTLEETVVIVTWLTRFRFKTLKYTINNGWFHRSLETDALFHITECGDCCQSFTLVNDPVFLLKSIVLSPFGKGPTLESVLKKVYESE